MSDYPEHEKVKALAGRNEVVGSFLEWLDEQGLTICERTTYKFDNLWTPTRKRFETLIAEFFGIDMEKLEAEKRRMLDELRAAQEGA